MLTNLVIVLVGVLLIAGWLTR